MALLSKNKATSLLKVTGFIAVALILAFFAIRETLVRVNIHGNSMLPVLHSGDTIIMQQRFFSPEVGKIYSIDKDTLPAKYNLSMSLVKRIVAGPGDKIEFDAVTGEPISLNGQKITFTPMEGEKPTFLLESHEEDSLGAKLRIVPANNNIMGITSYMLQPDQTIDTEAKGRFLKTVRYYPFLQEIAKNTGQRYVSLTVPEKHYFVLSDNLSSNLDSRFFGFVPQHGVTHRMLNGEGRTHDRI